jgi:hypothetical protein
MFLRIVQPRHFVQARAANDPKGYLPGHGGPPA